MKVKTLTKLLKEYLDKYGTMERRYPKAAKRRRIQKKWRRKYGPPFREAVEASILFGESTFYVPKNFEWKGGSYYIPHDYMNTEETK